jgi:transposase-like protein
MSKEIKQRYLTPKEAAKYLGVSEGTLANWRSQWDKKPKGPPFHRLGGSNRIRYDIVDLVEYMNENKIT